MLEQPLLDCHHGDGEDEGEYEGGEVFTHQLQSPVEQGHSYHRNDVGGYLDTHLLHLRLVDQQVARKAFY